MPKRGVDMKINEVVRFYKVHASKNLCEPISMIVPRKVSSSLVKLGFGIMRLWDNTCTRARAIRAF